MTDSEKNFYNEVATVCNRYAEELDGKSLIATFFTLIKEICTATGDKNTFKNLLTEAYCEECENIL